MIDIGFVALVVSWFSIWCLMCILASIGRGVCMGLFVSLVIS